MSIEEKDLVNILADLHIAEVMSMSKIVPRDSLQHFKLLSLEKIAVIHRYTSDQILRDIKALQKKPKDLIRIYQRVDMRLSELGNINVNGTNTSNDKK